LLGTKGYVVVVVVVYSIIFLLGAVYEKEKKTLIKLAATILYGLYCAVFFIS
jgi:hypothetical protein